MTKGTLDVVRLGAVALVSGALLVACGSGSGSKGAGTMQEMQPVSEELAAKAQSGCWFKVKNRSSKSEEVRLWNAATSMGSRIERLGELIIVTGALNPPVHEARYYGCSLFEYTAGSPVVMTATAGANPIRADSLIPYGFSKDGHKEIK